ncbi:MAG TPA: RsmE family RNA methyltransferase, partial [bacterium]|nr:RsmE family RNA methyltransferase [bacterium]
MSYFLAPQALHAGDVVWLEGDEAAHILKSRRLRHGERLALQDPGGARFSAELVQAQRGRAQVRILEPQPIPALPPLGLALAVACVKEKALELVLQKATELGVASVHVFASQHSPVAYDELAAPRTLARWQRIAGEASKQCGRQFPPSLACWADLPALLRAGRLPQPGWVLHPDAPPAATLERPVHEASVLVGPEGGFTPPELEQLRAAGFPSVSLGHLVLRTETAA